MYDDNNIEHNANNIKIRHISLIIVAIIVLHCKNFMQYKNLNNNL